MCVAFDYSKGSHTAIVCNGMGHQLRGRFDVHNNRYGIEYLMGIVAGLCRKHRIKKEHVFFGGEDCGPFAFNFIHALISRGFLVVGFNTKQVKDERENSHASTDLIDTIGVAGMMIKMKGRTIDTQSKSVHAVKRLRRQRRAMVKAHAASAHRMYSIVDQLLPGFLNEKLTGLTPFSRASLWFMEDKFSIPALRSRHRPALTRKLREFSVQDPEGCVEKLKALADSALPPPVEMIPALERSLSEERQLYSLLSNNIHEMDKDIAKLLAKTPGAMFTTIPGIGLRWAPGLYAELCEPVRRQNIGRMSAMGGLVPRIKQSGGPDKLPVIGHRTKKCSSILKHHLFSAAVSVARYGHSEMRAEYQADKDAGRDCRVRLAKKLLKICLYINDHQTFFLPPSLHRNGTHNQIRAYYAHMWPKVLIKWRDAGAILEAVAEDAPLRQWRDMAQELYDLNLDLKSPQTGRK
jgi:transposase